MGRAMAADRVEPPSGSSWSLVDLDSGELTGGPLVPGARLVAGRGSAVDVTLRDPGVSRRHFEIHNHGRRLELRDLGSKAGTFLNGVPVPEANVSCGDVVEAGSSRLIALRWQPRIPAVGPGTVEIVHHDAGTETVRHILDRSLVVGRHPECDIVIADDRVSRRHIEIHPLGIGARVEDLAPKNRVEINGRALEQSRQVSPGDRIQLASSDHVLVIETAAPHVGPVAVEVKSPGLSRAWSLEIDAGPESTVAGVASQVAERLNVARAGTATMYLADTGVLLHPGNRWSDCGVQRGARLGLVHLDQEPPPTPVQAVRHGPARVLLTRLPRVALPVGRGRVNLPQPPESQSWRGRGIVWQLLGGLGVILAGAVIAVVRPSYAIFALIGGIVGLLSITAAIMGDQSRRRHAGRRFLTRLEAVDGELAALRRTQSAALHEVNPSPAEALEWIATRGRRLWERRPGDVDFLRLRLGIGATPSMIDFNDTIGHGDDRHAAELRDVVDRHRMLDDVPVLTPAPDEAPVIGLVGGRREVLEVASWLVLQAAALHAPSDLEIAIPAVNQDWMWTRWLPHVERADGIAVTWAEADAAALARRIRGHVGGDRGAELDRGPSLLTVVPHGSGALLTDVTPAGGNRKALYLFLADHPDQLPARVDAVITVTGDRARYEGPHHNGAEVITVDRVDHRQAGEAARAMGRFGDAGRQIRQVSSQEGLLDLLGIASPENLDLASLWSEPRYPALSAVVGTSLDGEPLVLGFRSDGVHGVVGGTTGSGKSEFLQTLLMSLALTHRPDRLSLFLIDFKGGATFAGLADLPHVAGVVTDLETDPTLAHRAFTSLEAEMTRRKRILDQARVPGLTEYERLPEAASNPLPALLVVIDEFALLVRQQPDVKDRLDLVASQGRSLGVHLLLATQSPSNVITPAIRSNTQVWISLRVVDDAESIELLGHRDAARIPADRPGRAFVRFGGAESITGFQTARVARPIGSGSARSGIAVRPMADLPLPSASIPSVATDGRVVTELEVLCRGVADQSRDLGIPPSRRLWLEPLAPWIGPPEMSGPPRTPGGLTASVGVLDDPSNQRQEPWSVDVLKDGNILVVGARGSGKSTAMRQILLDLAALHPPSDLHLYGIESGTGSMSAVGGLAHCAAVVPVVDRERLYRVMGRLTRLMKERREGLASSGHGDFLSWRRTAQAPDPWTVLAIDDYPMFKEAADGSGLGLLNDQLMSLCQGGPSVGIHVMVTTSHPSDIRLNLLSLFGARILLRQGDAADYSLLDLRLRPNEVPPPIPGRALVEGGHQIQVFAVAEGRLDAIAETWDGDHGGPRPVERLPSTIPLAELASVSASAPVVGVAGDEYDPFVLETEGSEPNLVIAGEGGSGRTSALITIFQTLQRADPSIAFTILSPRPSAVRELGAGPGTVTVAISAEEIASALQCMAQDPGTRKILLIDDAESMPAEVGQQLERTLRDAGQLSVRSFIAGRTVDLGRSFEGWLRYVLSSRRGVALMPSPDAGSLFDVRLPASHSPLTPGRGFWCERGSATFIQLALPAHSGSSGPVE